MPINLAQNKLGMSLNIVMEQVENPLGPRKKRKGLKAGLVQQWDSLPECIRSNMSGAATQVEVMNDWPHGAAVTDRTVGEKYIDDLYQGRECQGWISKWGLSSGRLEHFLTPESPRCLRGVLRFLVYCGLKHLAERKSAAPEVAIRFFEFRHLPKATGKILDYMFKHWEANMCPSCCRSRNLPEAAGLVRAQEPPHRAREEDQHDDIVGTSPGQDCEKCSVKASAALPAYPAARPLKDQRGRYCCHWQRCDAAFLDLEPLWSHLRFSHLDNGSGIVGGGKRLVTDWQLAHRLLRPVSNRQSLKLATGKPVKGGPLLTQLQELIAGAKAADGGLSRHRQLHSRVGSSLAQGLLASAIHWPSTQPHPSGRGGYDIRYGYDRGQLACITLDVSKISDAEASEVHQIIDQLENSRYVKNCGPGEAALAPPYVGATCFGGILNLWMIAWKPITSLWSMEDAEAHTYALYLMREVVDQLKSSRVFQQQTPGKVNLDLIFLLPAAVSTRRVAVLLIGVQEAHCAFNNPCE